MSRDNAAPINRFKMAAHRVQDEERLYANQAGPSLHDVVQMARDANGNAVYDQDRELEDLHLPVLQIGSPSNRLNWGASDLQDTLQSRMRESTDILIRKIAEIQYEENLRQSQETIREALERVKKAQDRAQYMKSLRRDLKERLYGELEFRQANGSLKADEGSKEKEKSDHKHKQILQELKKEKEWQRRTEVMISKQEEKIEELRKEVKMEIRGIMEEQNKHYEEMKQMIQDSKALVPFQGSDQAYGSLDGSTRSGSNPDEQMTPRKRRRRRNIKTPVEERSRSSTPEFYIQ